jgi:hypothetical protein
MYHGSFTAHLGIYKNKFIKLVTLHHPINGSYVQQSSFLVNFGSNQNEQTLPFIRMMYARGETTIHYWSCANNSLGIPPNQATEWRWQHSLYKLYKNLDNKSLVSSLMIFQKRGKISTKKKNLCIFNKESSVFFHLVIHGLSGKLCAWSCIFTHDIYTVLKRDGGKLCHFNVS